MRWRLQRAAQGLLCGYRRRMDTPEGGTWWAPIFRVATCHRWTVGGGPAMYRDPGREASEYVDVYTCGSPWHCPICSAKVTSERRAQLMATAAAWTDRGGEVYLVTRTFSHERDGQVLADELRLFRDALSRAKGTRRALGVAARAGVVGTIRALETTHGVMNGWHPHTHELVLARHGERERLLSLRNAWVRLLIERGLAGMRDGMTRAERAEQLRYLRRHALTVQSGRYAGEYIAKFGLEPTTEQGGRWGVASELTKGHTKTGKRMLGRTPFELLRQYVDGDKWAGRLFREFAVAFHGKAQLYWSPGLRASLVELCERTADQARGATAEMWNARARAIGRNRSDEDIAATASPKCTEFVYRYSTEEWRLVLRMDARHEALMAGQLDGREGVLALLERLRGFKPTHRDDFLPDWRPIDRARPVAL